MVKIKTGASQVGEQCMQLLNTRVSPSTRDGWDVTRRIWIPVECSAYGTMLRWINSQAGWEIRNEKRQQR